MITTLTSTPTWVWLSIGTLLELLLRVVPTSKPYYTILGMLKFLFDKVVPDASTHTEDVTITNLTEVKGKLVDTPTTIKKRKFWKLFAK